MQKLNCNQIVEAIKTGFLSADYSAIAISLKIKMLLIIIEFLFSILPGGILYLIFWNKFHINIHEKLLHFTIDDFPTLVYDKFENLLYWIKSSIELNNIWSFDILPKFQISFYLIIALCALSTNWSRSFVVFSCKRLKNQAFWSSNQTNSKLYSLL